MKKVTTLFVLLFLSLSAIRSRGQTTPVTVNLSSSYNVSGIVTDGSTFGSGIDGNGFALSENLLGSTQTVQGVPLTLGPANAPDAVSSATITLPAGQYAALNMLAIGVNGNQASQTFTVTYSDNSTSTITQSLSDWFTPQNYPGESVALSMPYRDSSSGGRDNETFSVYGYSFLLNSGKMVSSVSLPNNPNVVVLALTLLPPSSSGSMLNSGSGQIFDAQGNIWTLVQSASNGLQIALNGSVQSVTHQVILLLYFQGTIYQENTDNNWWAWEGSPPNWVAVSGDPRPAGSPNPSPSGTTLNSTSGQIFDSQGSSWTLVQSASDGLQIALNGSVQSITHQVILLLYFQGVVYQENVNNNWWAWEGSPASWVAVSGDPRASSVPSASGTTLNSTSGQIIDGQGNTWTLVNSSNGLQIALNGSVQSVTHQVILLLYFQGVVYQENVDNNWWAWEGSPPSWVAISGDPRGGTPPTAPSQASAVGYTNLSFSDDFTSTSTIDVNGTNNPGFNWYTTGWFGQGGTSPSNINISGSVLTLGGDTSTNASLTSAVATANSPFFVGTVFGNGAYFEASIAFDPAQGANATGWPSFWSMSIEHVYDADHQADEQWPGQQSGYAHFAELDFFEAFHNPNQSYVGMTGYASTIHDWSGIFNNGWPFNIQNGNNGFNVGNVDWNQFHTYGALWVPASGSTPGYVQWYFDNQPGPINYYIGPIGNPPLPGQDSGNFTASTTSQATDTFAIIDQQRLPLVLGTDAAWPMRVDWVRVWQKP